MAQRKRRKQQHSGRPARSARPVPPSSAPAEPDLLAEVRQALSGGHPLVFLAVISALLAAVDPRQRHPFDREPDPDLPERDELVRSFLEIERRETSAILAAVGDLLGDEVTRARIRRELDRRGHELPLWLTSLAEARVTEVAQLSHALGDGENIVLGVTLAGGRELSVVVYVDHNLGTVVKDAFVLPEAATSVTELMISAAEDPDMSLTALDPADARVRIADAVEHGALMFPPLESDSWPACRPLVEWAVRRLPEGGTGYSRPEWDDEALRALTERFLGSPFATDLGGSEEDRADHRGLLDSVLWFGTDYGPGDPLRWSPAAVEILLDDWLPRKIVAEAEYLAKAPALLRAFVRFCHHERGIRSELTEETIQAVDQLEPAYQRVIRSPRPQGPAALLAAMGLHDPEGPLPESLFGALADAETQVAEYVLGDLGRAVGGPRALEELDDIPLPDEPFSWDGVPDDIRASLEPVLTLADRGCAEFFDVEHRTAARRLLAQAAVGDPAVFRRRAKPETTAAALCWIIAKANDSFDAYWGEKGPQVGAVMSHFGVSSASQRARVLLEAAGVDEESRAADYGGINLGSPRYLVSQRRSDIVELRDRHAANIASTSANAPT